MIQPCPICGYDWPASAPASSDSSSAPGPDDGEVRASAACPGCGSAPAEETLRTRSGTWSGLRAALWAIPRGVQFLVSTRGVKRWILPPAILSFTAFVALTWWLWSLTVVWIERAQSGAQDLVSGEPTWWRIALEWVITKTVIVVLAKLTGFALVTAVGLIVMLWTFSLVYEMLSGPFLDEIHGRIEKRWFGLDPRDERERPRDISSDECLRVSLVCGAIAVALFAGSWLVEGALVSWAALLAGAAAFAVAGRRKPEYGRWLRWRLAVELRTLGTSLQASAIAAALLVFALPLLLIPFVGYPLFYFAAGFTTAVSLLDIPMSRRRWELGLRLSFLLHNLPAVMLFGLCASLVFIVPIVGPLAMVPAASVGGLWLFCRLDKSRLRGG